MTDAGTTLNSALADHSAEGWLEASWRWSRYLQPEKRMAHAMAALAACEDDDIETVCSVALGAGGSPIAGFDNTMDDASFWADLATPKELKAYSVACYLRLSHRDRIAFHEWADGRAAA